MNDVLKKQLNQLLKKNKNWPIIIEMNGLQKDDFKSATFMSAQIDWRELTVVNELNGPILPDWVKKVCSRENEKTNLLAIYGMDQISFDSQQKFVSFLDGKHINNFQLPKNLQIILLIDNGNRAKICKEILSLCLYYKVD